MKFKKAARKSAPWTLVTVLFMSSVVMGQSPPANTGKIKIRAEKFIEARGDIYTVRHDVHTVHTPTGRMIRIRGDGLLYPDHLARETREEIKVDESKSLYQENMPRSEFDRLSDLADSDPESPGPSSYYDWNEKTPEEWKKLDRLDESQMSAFGQQLTVLKKIIAKYLKQDVTSEEVSEYVRTIFELDLKDFGELAYWPNEQDGKNAEDQESTDQDDENNKDETPPTPFIQTIQKKNDPSNTNAYRVVFYLRTHIQKEPKSKHKRKQTQKKSDLILFRDEKALLNMMQISPQMMGEFELIQGDDK